MRKSIPARVWGLLVLVVWLVLPWSGLAYAAPAKSLAASPGGIVFTRVCAVVPARHARCMAMIAQVKKSGRPLVVKPNASPTGGNAPYGPANLHNAYKLPTTASGTPTVAIVDAYNDPNAASDLATYRSTYGLPACTVASGCLQIVSQTGSTTNLPTNDASWAIEESLDLDMVSAICQNCHILLVEANSSSDSDLGTAVNEAVSLGAIAVSNSYGEAEFSSESSPCSTYYQHNNVAITASSGDSGLGVFYPAVCPFVTGVGGTTLGADGTETAWNTSSTKGAGGGCSAYISMPTWQASSITGCTMKAVSDVSADADPNTGVDVYDTYGQAGWVEVGGTSESSPIIAATYALAGNVASAMYPASLPWNRYSTSLFEVGGARYAYQGGLGSPNGTSDF